MTIKKLKEKKLIYKGIQVAMLAEIGAIQLVGDGDGAHAAFAASLLDVGRDIALRAEKQLSTFSLEAGAGAAVLHAYVFIFLAVFDKHYFTRPMMRHYQPINI